MFNMASESCYFHIKTYFNMIFKQRVKKLLKRLVDSPKQDIIVFNIPVIIAKMNQISAQGLKSSNYFY